MIIPLTRRPVSFTGQSLAGERLLRFIYVDEAGISAPEPVAIVAGVIIGADKQWRELETYLGDIVTEFIPATDRSGFIFHATSIFSGTKYFDREKWPLDVRLRILKQILSARWKIGISIVIGYDFKEDNFSKNEKGYALVRHLMAYGSCLVGCEQYMRQFGEPGEVALVVAEDTPEARRHIKQAHHEITAPDSKFPGYREIIPFRHIVDTVHFAEKSHSALLQFADAFAFVFRRYLGGMSHADELIDAVRGPMKIDGINEFGKSGYNILAATGPFSLQPDATD